uniref:Uncharacterized protein n=1 Tax=Glossina palpalis gambiensis TaxID=67801 RepID=A0A1B0BIE8_9MUSC
MVDTSPLILVTAQQEDRRSSNTSSQKLMQIRIWSHWFQCFCIVDSILMPLEFNEQTLYCHFDRPLKPWRYIYMVNEMNPALTGLPSSGNAASNVGVVTSGMVTGAMINTVVSGIGGTVLLPNSSSSSSSSSSTSSSNHLHMLNTGAGNSTSGTGCGNVNGPASSGGGIVLTQHLLHSNTSSNTIGGTSNNNVAATASNGGGGGNGGVPHSSNSSGGGGGGGGIQQPSPQAPPTYVNL